MTLTEVAAAVIERPGEFLLAQRPEGKPYAGYWEFPGGKIEPGESPEHALVREVREELGVTATPLEVLAAESHDYPGGPSVEIVFIHCSLDSFELGRGRGIHDLRWWTLDEVNLTQVLAADRGFLTRLGAGSAPRGA